ncbi:MAG: DUF3566 domain-containing protein [Micropruina sp.]|nr:DUF3566 domain-containing protein [Micropruina sp.]
MTDAPGKTDTAHVDAVPDFSQAPAGAPADYFRPTDDATIAHLPPVPVITGYGNGPVPAGAQVPVAAAPAAAAPAPARKPAVRRTRKARLRLSRIDPWSVMKTSFLFSVAFGIMFWVATYVVWSVIGASGLFDALDTFIQSILSSPNDTTPVRIEDFVNTNKVLGVAALIAVINVVILTALGTVTSFLYNLSANILGGLELTLAED